MGAIDRRLALHTRPSARERFWIARRTMNLALLAWLHEQPPDDDVELEVAGTIDVVRQLAQVQRAGGQS